MVDPELRQKLIAEGWDERFSASGTRLAEAELSYKALGYEVRVEGLDDVAQEGRCTSCFAQSSADGPVGVIFTRGAPGGGSGEDDLFDDQVTW